MQTVVDNYKDGFEKQCILRKGRKYSSNDARLQSSNFYNPTLVRSHCVHFCYHRCGQNFRFRALN